jgi:hypothetical protein
LGPIRIGRTGSKAVQLANGTDPEFALLPEADRSDMAFYLKQLRIVLPIVGCDLFRPSHVSRQIVGRAENPIFVLESVGANATARDTDLGFVVLAGSTARKQATASFPQGYRSISDQLVADRKLVEGPDPGAYRFAMDVSFPSPSAAATVVMARSANGHIEWKERCSGRTYRGWRQL